MAKRSLMDAWLDEVSVLRPGQHAESIQLNERFWKRIPEPKLKQEVAFHVLTTLVFDYFHLGKLEEALERSKLLDQFDFEAEGRIDDGEKDLTVGRVYFALGDHDEALRRWKIADRRSRGRCFQLPFAEGVRPLYLDLAKGNPVPPARTAPAAKAQSAANVEESCRDLDDDVAERIEELSEEGNQQMDRGDLDGAIKTFTAALDLVPEPKYQYDAAGWLWASIGDAYYEKKEYEQASSYFGLAHGLAEMLDNPFVLLRLGQCALESGDEEKAVDFLLRAYMVEGKKIFKDEKKFYDFLASKVDLSRGSQGSSSKTKKSKKARR